MGYTETTTANDRELTVSGHRPVQCAEHPGQPAAYCGPCRSELIAIGDSAALAKRKREIAAARWAALVEPEFADASLADFPDPPPEAVAWLRGWNTYADPCPWLIINGTTGTGKTHLAYALARAAVTGDRPAEWISTTAPAMYASLRPSAPTPEVALYKLQSTPLLLIDDLGVNKLTEWVEETTHTVLDERYRRRLPVIITTNLEVPDFKAAVGDRMASRLRQRCYRLTLDGPDRREPPTLEAFGLAPAELKASTNR